MPDGETMSRQQKKKKVDYAALNSPFMRIPKMDVATARDLLDLGFQYPHELAGRAPEALLSDLQKIRVEIPRVRLSYFRMAVYFAETPEPEPGKLNPWVWED